MYYYIMNRSRIAKTKSVVIYGAGRAGIKLESEFANSQYKVRYFIDDDKVIQNRSIDSIQVISKHKLKEKIGEENKFDLLVIAMPSASAQRVKDIYDNLSIYFKHIQILPSIDDILESGDFAAQLKNISVEDLLARHPKDLDKKRISSFVKDKIILITGAGGKHMERDKQTV
jgi:FlaA1/EpsC-like NDP-sugar epimerase